MYSHWCVNLPTSWISVATDILSWSLLYNHRSLRLTTFLASIVSENERPLGSDWSDLICLCANWSCYHFPEYGSCLGKFTAYKACICLDFTGSNFPLQLNLFLSIAEPQRAYLWLRNRPDTFRNYFLTCIKDYDEIITTALQFWQLK
jgi:hypothetical protein